MRAASEGNDPARERWQINTAACKNKLRCHGIKTDGHMMAIDEERGNTFGMQIAPKHSGLGVPIGVLVEPVGVH